MTIGNNEFVDSWYFEIDYESVPSGFDNMEKRSNRKHVKSNVGKHDNPQNHLNTADRKDLITRWDEEGVLTQTANKFILRVDSNQYQNVQEALDDIKAEVAEESGLPPGIVEQKIGINFIGNQQDALNFMDEYAAEYGEQI